MTKYKYFYNMFTDLFGNHGAAVSRSVLDMFESFPIMIDH